MVPSNVNDPASIGPGGRNPDLRRCSYEEEHRKTPPRSPCSNTGGHRKNFRPKTKSKFSMIQDAILERFNLDTERERGRQHSVRDRSPPSPAQENRERHDSHFPPRHAPYPERRYGHRVLDNRRERDYVAPRTHVAGPSDKGMPEKVPSPQREQDVSMETGQIGSPPIEDRMSQISLQQITEVPPRNSAVSQASTGRANVTNTPKTRSASKAGQLSGSAE